MEKLQRMYSVISDFVLGRGGPEGLRAWQHLQCQAYVGSLPRPGLTTLQLEIEALLWSASRPQTCLGHRHTLRVWRLDMSHKEVFKGWSGEV